MASLIYSSSYFDALRGGINFETDIFGLMLVDASYKADRSLHTRRSDVKGEIKGDGYSAGGVVTKVAMKREGDLISIALGGITLKDATVTARGAVYFKRRGGDASGEELVAHVDFGRDVTSTNGDFVVDPSSIRIQN